MPIALIFNCQECAVYGEAEDRAALRPQLDALRLARPGQGFILTSGETRDEALRRAGHICSLNLVNDEQRKSKLRLLPPVVGQPEISKSDWDEAMLELSVARRGEVANLAAHGWSISRNVGGLLVSGNQTYAFTGSERVSVERPAICQTCTYRESRSVRGTERPLSCRLSYRDDIQLNVSRDVGRIQSCAAHAWKAE